MLDVLSDEALGTFRAALAYDFEAASASPEAYSAPLHRWLIDEAKAEMARRVGEATEPSLLSGLTADERRQAATFAAALAMSFGRIAEGLTPESMTAATRAKFARLAAELSPVMVELAEALTDQAGAVLN